MPFSWQYPPTRNTSRLWQDKPNIAVLFVVGFITFLIGLGIGIGQGLKAGAATDSKLAAAEGRIEDRTFLGFVKGVGSAPPRGTADDVDFNLFWDVWNDIKRDYYEQPVSEKELFYGALEGMASALGDPYSMYLEPPEADDFSDSLKGEFSGIGAEIGVKDDELQVIAPLPDSPAERAGVRSRDRIVAIDGEDSLAMPVEEAVMKIRGEKGTDVVLTLGRYPDGEDGDAGPDVWDVTITRDTITVKSARLMDEGDGIYRIEIRSFNEDVADTFEQLVDEALAKDAKGLVIDVRNDPGGYLDRAVTVAGEWLKGEVVVEQRKQGKIIEQLRGTGRGDLKGMPTVVLINEGSASASEILAGALQDYGAATLVGVKTFGKGSVQDYVEYDDGSALKITISEWLTPKGRSIDREGIAPDVEVEMTDDDYNADRDPQLEKALEILKNA
jgi:carboxyl-terminal processing protease